MWILIGVTAALLVCDRVLKALARSEKLRYRGKLLQLTHLENPGFFLGKGSRYPRLLRWAPLGIWLLAAALLLPDVERRTAPALLTLTGGLSNQYDRLRRGSVTDYVRFPGAGKKLRSLVWNLADFMLLGGTVLTAIGLLRELIKGK